MKVICFALCLIVLVFPLAACQASPAAEDSELLTESRSDNSEIQDAEVSSIQNEIPQKSIMGKVTMIESNTVTVETVGFGGPVRGKMPGEFEGTMPIGPEEKTEPVEPPIIAREKPTYTEGSKEGVISGEVPFENEGFVEAKEFNIETAEIFIEYQGGRVSGGIGDITVGSIVSLELDDEENAVEVTVQSEFNSEAKSERN